MWPNHKIICRFLWWTIYHFVVIVMIGDKVNKVILKYFSILKNLMHHMEKMLCLLKFYGVILSWHFVILILPLGFFFWVTPSLWIMLRPLVVKDLSTKRQILTHIHIKLKFQYTSRISLYFSWILIYLLRVIIRTS